jgi:hypothetical protein
MTHYEPDPTAPDGADRREPIGIRSVSVGPKLAFRHRAVNTAVLGNTKRDAIQPRPL